MNLELTVTRQEFDLMKEVIGGLAEDIEELRDRRSITPITGQEVSDILHANQAEPTRDGWWEPDYTAIAEAINKRMGVK